MKPEIFVQYLEEKGIILNEAQQRAFDIYFKELVEWNEKNKFDSNYRRRGSV